MYIFIKWQTIVDKTAVIWIATKRTYSYIPAFGWRQGLIRIMMGIEIGPYQCRVINRPGVARDVLETASSFIDSLHSVESTKKIVTEIIRCFLVSNKLSFIWNIHLVPNLEIFIQNVSSSYKILVKFLGG